ncbi:MAG: acyltransferase [Bacteroidetes bacterium]|nr:acyltransferase [Bacteroidota bacterium]
MVSQRNRSFDSLRGIFALMVVFTHIEYIRHNFSLPNHFFNPFFFHLGKIGVSGFFVLSGFLITGNLLREKDKPIAPASRKIRLFYLKRVLRIFPLYYLIIFISIFLLPYIESLHYFLPERVTDGRQIIQQVAPYYYFLLPQVPLSQGIVLPFAEPAWSIGVEEMFYLLIPVCIYYARIKKNWLLFLSAVLVAVKLFYVFFVDRYYADHFLSLMALSRFECIFMGCYAAFLVHEKHSVLEKINRKTIYLALLLLLVCFVTLKRELFIYVHFSILFAVIILYLNKHKVSGMENRILSFLGKISFSLYMTHEIVIVFFLNLEIFSDPRKYAPPLLYVLVLIFSIILGWLFYKVIEEPFIKIKDRLKVHASRKGSEN